MKSASLDEFPLWEVMDNSLFRTESGLPLLSIAYPAIGKDQDACWGVFRRSPPQIVVPEKSTEAVTAS